MESEGKSHPGEADTPETDLKGYETVFTNAKAGMNDVDKEKVKKIVYELSKVTQEKHSP